MCAETRPGLAVVVSGPSGTGKTTLCRLLVERYGYELSLSVTTRPPRQGETDGVDYHFVSREAFRDAARRGEFLEYSEHFGHAYATPRAPVEEALKNGRDILLEIDVNGASQVMERFPEAFCLFVTAPHHEEMERRLRSRHSEDEASIRTRLQRADMEMKMAMKMEYKARVMNDDLEETVVKVHDIIQRELEARKRHGCGKA